MPQRNEQLWNFSLEYLFIISPFWKDLLWLIYGLPDTEGNITYLRKWSFFLLCMQVIPALNLVVAASAT